jgi:hypothetical protein
MVDSLKVLERQGLSGSIYTQPFDVEGEQNGLMTYDRAVIKIPVATIRTIHEKLVPTAQNYAVATQGFAAADADLTPAAERYAAALAEYGHRKRDLPFLRHLTMMAIRQTDQANATAVGNEYIARLPQPHSKDALAFIEAVTRTPNDTGFAMFRTETARVDSVLGKDRAERIREVVAREQIAPALADSSHVPDWDAIEQRVAAKYGALGVEEVYGARMAYYWDKKDWGKFGADYVRYFATAAGRSEYNINAASWDVFLHITDPAVLAAALTADKYNVDTFDMNDAPALDTYASLLYKVGRTQEAIEWEDKAVKLDARNRNPGDEPNKVFAETFQKMRAGQPIGDH